jgi:hypothetical protein
MIAWPSTSTRVTIGSSTEAGQIAAHPVDRILDVLHRLFGRHFHTEDHIGGGTCRRPPST